MAGTGFSGTRILKRIKIVKLSLQFLKPEHLKFC